MTKLKAVIVREYLARVRSRWFIATTILAPILLVGILAIPVILTLRQPEQTIEISVVDETGLVIPELLKTEPFQSGRITFSPSGGGDSRAVADRLRDRVMNQEISGFLHIPENAFDGAQIEFWGRDVTQTIVRSTLSGAVSTAVHRVQAQAMGLDPAAADRLTRSVSLATYRITTEGSARDSGQAVLTANVLGIMIYMVVLLYGAMMLRAAVAEKSSKTVEIILSSLRPWELMLGKTLGVGAVGLTQIGVWLAFLAVVFLLAGGAQAFSELEFLRNLPVGSDTLFMFLGLFLTGYFLYGGMYASVGAIASNEQEASQLQFPVTLLVIVPILIMPIVLETPTSTGSAVLSWIPFFTPVLFLARYVLDAVAVWEIPFVFTVQILSIVLVAWIGGRIYRVGLLMTGKRPNLPELIRWIRHG